MKKLTFQNKDIPVLMDFLNSTTLKPAATRGKHKLIDRLEEKIKDYSRDEMELIKTVAELDENGEVSYNEDGKPLVRKDLSTKEFNEYMKQKKELDEEEIVIEFAEYSKKFEALFKGLEEYDHEIPADVSRGYVLLMDEYDNLENE
jgi:hypothetical protein